MMIPLNKRISAFAKLGMILQTPLQNDVLKKLIEEVHFYNPWFTPENVENAMTSIANVMSHSKLNEWMSPYQEKLEQVKEQKVVGVVMAGNLPLVGFHDFMSVLMSGHKIQAKLSKDDDKLLPAIAEILIEIEPQFEQMINFQEGKMKDFDAVIATGSNNTARYFEYYFGKYQNIIRKNRNGVAVLTGEETVEEIRALGRDIFQYFGMGCRSVSRIFIPDSYDLKKMLSNFEIFSEIGNHHKYRNNYDYYKSIYLVNKEKHLDNGFLLLKEEHAYGSPPSVLFYTKYNNIEELNHWLELDKEKIQCVVSQTKTALPTFPLGKAQEPELWDYADGVDVMEFLLGL